MWKIDHYQACPDGKRINVVREILTVEDAEGNTIEAATNYQSGIVLSADCAECGAVAVWEGN